MDDVLVLWDIDGTLLNAGGVGRDLYNVVFLQLFGRSLSAYAPMAGRTDRAIILETLTLAGVDEPRRYVDPFIAGLGEHAPLMRSALVSRGQVLPGAAAALSLVGGHAHQSVLTGNIRPLAEAKLTALGLRDGLDLCIGAYGDDHEDRAQLVEVARRRAAAVHGRSVVVGVRRHVDRGDRGHATRRVGGTVRRRAGGGRRDWLLFGRRPGRRGRARGAALTCPTRRWCLTRSSISCPAAPALGRSPLGRSPLGRCTARQPGEHGLSLPVQPRWRSASASCRAVSQALRVTSFQP